MPYQYNKNKFKSKIDQNIIKPKDKFITNPRDIANFFKSFFLDTDFNLPKTFQDYSKQFTECSKNNSMSLFLFKPTTEYGALYLSYIEEND